LHSDLASLSGLSSNALDRHNSLGDLRHLEFEKLSKQVWVGSAHDDAKASGAVVYLVYVNSQSVVRAVRLGRNLFPSRKLRFDHVDLDQDALTVCRLTTPVTMSPIFS